MGGGGGGFHGGPGAYGGGHGGYGGGGGKNQMEVIITSQLQCFKNKSFCYGFVEVIRKDYISRATNYTKFRVISGNRNEIVFLSN